MRARNLAPLLILAAVLAQPTIASAQVDSPTADARDDRDGGNLGWLGLLGLAGLFGLRGRDRKNVNDVSATRRAV
ncbi:MAG TPA: WGxxGxxG family protein [Woeseiaceae bacterium]|nr:WGxxGxxG family protein [Woeseiaceae bacterium]